MNYIIKNATIINEGTVKVSSLYIKNGIIEAIDDWANLKSLTEPHEQLDLFDATKNKTEQIEVVDAAGMWLLPGVIDSHVHFRDPGLTEKADFRTESCAAVAGGVTSIIDMPNTKPQTTDMQQLENKLKIASEKCVINYGLMLGATNDNIDEILKADPTKFAAIKLFLGSSTGNMLVNDEKVLDHLFKESKKLIVVHSEDERVVQNNMANAKAQFEGTVNENASLHPKIRTTEACYLCTYHAVERARKYGTHLHIAHISTATELNLLSNQSMDEKHITAEVTPNHLWFDDRDYAELGNKIKCNPAIKSNNDRLALWAGLYDGLIDTIATDHAPHTLESKQLPYFQAPSGIPSIQHSLTMMLEPCVVSDMGEDSNDALLPLIVEKMCHAPAKLFHIENRGYIRKGYWADLTLVEPGAIQTVDKSNLLYKCGWSPLEGQKFHSKVKKTWVNGKLVWDGKVVNENAGEALKFKE